MTRNMKWLSGVSLAVAFALGVVLPIRGDDVAQAGRQTVSKWQDAVITIKLVIKTTMSSRGEGSDKREEKSEVTGTIIDPSGLTVASLSAVDPSEAYNRMMAHDASGPKVTSDITDLQLILPNGDTLPGAVVLRDKDLDLAFIRPKQKPSAPLAAVDLSKASKPELLDQAILLYRLGAVGSRSLSVCVDRVQCIMEKPRTFYSLGIQAMATSLGAPVFAVDSSPIGLLLLRVLPSGMSESPSMFGGIGGMGVMYVVLPAGDVAEAAAQAPQTAPATVAQPTPPKPSPPKPKPAK